jgi:protein-tyrosine phosphatase
LKRKILFVCLGNICRSPLAEAIFSKLAEEQGMAEFYKADSCGTSGHHIGEQPDSRTLRNARKNKLQIQHRGRQLHPDDFHSASLILTMDRHNYQETKALATRHGFDSSDIRMLRSFDPLAVESNPDVPDPWYGGEEGFEEVFQIIFRSCSGLLEVMQKSHPHLPEPGLAASDL